MYNRWSDKDKEALCSHYPNASKEEILNTIPNRGWQAICETAHYYGLHRSYAEKGKAIREGKKNGQSKKHRN